MAVHFEMASYNVSEGSNISTCILANTSSVLPVVVMVTPQQNIGMVYICTSFVHLRFDFPHSKYSFQKTSLLRLPLWPLPLGKQGSAFCSQPIWMTSKRTQKLFDSPSHWWNKKVCSLVILGRQRWPLLTLQVSTSILAAAKEMCLHLFSEDCNKCSIQFNVEKVS